jgi:uroporphyrinogen-III synthase
MSGLVVVTRPRQEALLLAAELGHRGYDVLVEPMLEIARLPVSLPHLGNYSALAFTSANAVDAFAALTGERGLPAYAVGAHTAMALREAGFSAIYETGGDAGDLAQTIGESSIDGPVLHVSGKAVAQDLGDLLSPHKIAVDRIALYDAVAVKKLSQTLIKALYARTVQDVLFFSVRTAATFGTLMREGGFTEMLGSTRAICLSPSIATEASKLSWKEISITGRPTTGAALACLIPPR